MTINSNTWHWLCVAAYWQERNPDYVGRVYDFHAATTNRRSVWF
ncbi:MAG: hypothetical protein ACHQU0_03895 [Candidatus Paceibacteria bacterium]